MRRDSFLIFGFSLSLTIAIVGGAYYMTVVRTPQQDAAELISDIAPDVERDVGMESDSQPASQRRTNRIIECFDETVGKFWTDAIDCESADLNNRISRAERFREIDYLSRDAEETRRNLQTSSKAGSSRKPSLRRTIKAVPAGLSGSCKFAVGRALEIERLLSAADDPAESTWRENYCKWVNEAGESACNVGRDFFYYGELCRYGS